MSRLRHPSGLQSSLILLAVVTAQIVVLRIRDPVGVFVILGLATAGSRIVGVTYHRVVTTVYRIVLIVLPIFITRLITGTPLVETTIEWTSYAGRLVTAAIIAQGYYSAVGTSGIHRGFSVPLRLLPRRIAYSLGHIVSSSLYLIPGVTSTVRTTFNAARVRYADDRLSGDGTLARHASTVRTTMVALLAIPRERAEAMVIRGLYRNAETLGVEKKPPVIAQ